MRRTFVAAIASDLNSLRHPEYTYGGGLLSKLEAVRDVN